MTVWELFIRAQTHQQRGELPQAERLYRQILAGDPGHAPSLHNLGILHQYAGQSEAAAGLIRQAIARQPGSADMHGNLGLVLHTLGRFDEALAEHETALRINPDAPPMLCNYGSTLHKLQRHAEAQAAFRRALDRQPSFAGAWVGLGLSLMAIGDTAAAGDAFARAARADPKNFDAHNNLGIIHQLNGDSAAALKAFKRAEQIAPHRADVVTNLGVAYRKNGDVNAAADRFERALTLAPTAAAQMNLGAARLEQYRLGEAWPLLEQSVGRADASIDAVRTYLFCLNYRGDVANAFVDAEHRRLGNRFGEVPETLPRARVVPAGDPLRVGFVSPDFREHAVARFIRGLLAHHDRRRITIVGYHNLSIRDAMTDASQALCDGWHDIHALDDAAAADLIRADGIDVLVDLAGHGGGGRPTLFAGKPVAVQVGFLGYPHATALPAMDFRITDGVADPADEPATPGEERPLRIDGCAWQFTPDPAMPAPSALPCLARGTVTFGSLNNYAKLSPATVACWAAVLHAVPGSRLLLKSSQRGGEAADSALRDAFAAHGIDAARLQTRANTPTVNAHYAIFAEIDIALDPFPYNGTTTTCDALWMGLPVVTLRGTDHRSRVSASLLTAIGCTAWVAENPQEYATIAAELAADRPALQQWRERLRGMVVVSPLADAAGYARRIEAVFYRAHQMILNEAGGRPTA